MRNKLLITVGVLLSLSLFSQKKEEVLLTIDKEPVFVSEFKRVYEKNLNQVSEKEKDIDKNLDLFINYKLKVKEAYDLGLNDSKEYQRELSMYRNQLITPYLQDEEFQEQLVKEAYDRTKEEVRASHILIRFPKDSEKADTLAMISKLKEISKRVEKGESFETLAKEMSEDPSAKKNGGDLGYFSAFRMVYPFEVAAYNTDLGKISEPFKTQFGYHILKVTDKRLSKGQFEAAHILVKNVSDIGKSKIDALYNRLKSGEAFEKVAQSSDDKGTANVGGKLPKFTTGQMVLPFEKAVLGLKNEGDYSKPFKTRFGWHITKLLKKYPIKSFDELKGELKKKVKSSGRGRLATEKVIKRLKKDYTITKNKELLDWVEKNNGKTKAKDEEVIVTVNDKSTKLKEFVKFLQFRKRFSFKKNVEDFVNTQVINYYKDNLENTEPEFKHTVQEYKDGLLLFDLMQQKIWNKSAKDSLGLQTFFKTNKSKYKADDLDKIKGQVMTDYQKHLEDSWINDLRNKSAITIKKKALKKLKKIYQ